jgi:hypothetical protein
MTMTLKTLVALSLGFALADVTWTEWIVAVFAVAVIVQVVRVARRLHAEAAKDQQRRLSHIVAIRDYRQQARRMR